MTADAAFWLFHLPNYVLAALMYTCIGRFILSFMFTPDSPNYIWRAFVRLTDPAVKAVGYVTPAIVPTLLVILFTAIWLFVARMALFLAFAAFGVAPTP